ncbi:MAG: glycosyltransferase [Treponema sp.]|jgi:1-acyl-sn-glycerol-3-phosphate acyltransferase|nr:glycosyltransferase [Treponema sp.]
MVIVFVEDNYTQETDGTAVSAHRFREELIKRGHTVRVLGIGVQGKDMYGLKEHYVPIATPVAKKNTMRFAKFDRKIITDALSGADLVHLFFPWQIERKCLRLARKMGIPVSGAFHCQPENVTYNIKLKLLGFINTALYFLFKIWLYRKLDNIHCPSEFTASELRKHKYQARLHVISNGVCDAFKPPEAGEGAKNDGFIRVLMTGRLAEEKRQDLIIKAVKHSRYADKIKLTFAGQGHMLKRYMRLSRRLPIAPRFGFFPQDELLKIIHETDIYIHASDAEIEGIACLEALSCGKVPIISDSGKSAASQFALDERSLFKKGSYRDLRDKLDYWIEHRLEREEMGKKYAKLGEAYNISYSVIKLEKMFADTIRDYKTKKLIKAGGAIKKYSRRVERNNYIKEFFRGVFYFGIIIPLLIIINRVLFGLKVENRRVLKKIRKTGAITICNHIHEMDSPICAVGIPTRKLICVSQPSNFKLGIAGVFVSILGSVPTPSTPKELQVFIYTLSKYLRKRKLVHFYPEGALIRYNRDIRQFQRGAFYLAADAQVPILPMRIVCREPDGLFKLFKKKPCLTLIFGEPIRPNAVLIKNDAARDLQKRAENAMQNLAG